MLLPRLLSKITLLFSTRYITKMYCTNLQMVSNSPFTVSTQNHVGTKVKWSVVGIEPLKFTQIRMQDCAVVKNKEHREELKCSRKCFQMHVKSANQHESLLNFKVMSDSVISDQQIYSWKRNEIFGCYAVKAISRLPLSSPSLKIFTLTGNRPWHLLIYSQKCNNWPSRQRTYS